MVEICGVTPHSRAARAGIMAGDCLMEINGHAISDVLDYRFYLAERTVTLTLRRGTHTGHVTLHKGTYDDIGLQFETPLMDRKQHCRNKCIFCFIDQLPRGLRESLYFKDDDARLSFLHGNYITLTNLTDRDIDRIIEFGSTAAAFAGGQGEFSVEFEPSATALEQEGVGYVVASCGVESGYVPYTAYSAKESYIEENPEIIQGFTNALQRGMDYVNSHTPEEIARIIQPQFKENDLETVTRIVERYQEQDTWKENLIFEEESFELLQDILDSAGELEERVPYQELVDVTYAQKAAK